MKQNYNRLAETSMLQINNRRQGVQKEGDFLLSVLTFTAAVVKNIDYLNIFIEENSRYTIEKTPCDIADSQEIQK